MTFRELFQQETEENSKEEVQRGIYLRIKYRARGSSLSLSLSRRKAETKPFCRLGMKPFSLLLVYSVVSRAMNEERVSSVKRNAFRVNFSFFETRCFFFFSFNYRKIYRKRNYTREILFHDRLYDFAIK